MKKNLLSIFIICTIILTKHAVYAQCVATFSCSIMPSAAANGKIVIYRESTTGSQMDSVTSQNVSTPTFTIAAPDSGKYILKFVPSSLLYQVSYSDTAKSWDKATVYNNFCFNSFSAVFSVPQYDTLTAAGTGEISGKLIEGQSYGKRTNGVKAPGQPIGGIIVKGGRNPGGQFFSQTITNSNGDYRFKNLPAGDYFILVDIPGLDTASTHHITLNGNQINNLGFVIDSAQVVPSTSSSVTAGPDVSVNEINEEKYNFNIFPNPIKNYFNLEFNVIRSSKIKIEIYDIAGKKVKDVYNSTHSKGIFKQQFIISDLRSGMYFMKTYINHDEIIFKLIVTD